MFWFEKKKIIFSYALLSGGLTKSVNSELFTNDRISKDLESNIVIIFLLISHSICFVCSKEVSQ